MVRLLYLLLGPYVVFLSLQLLENQFMLHLLFFSSSFFFFLIVYRFSQILNYYIDNRKQKQMLISIIIWHAQYWFLLTILETFTSPGLHFVKLLTLSTLHCVKFVWIRVFSIPLFSRIGTESSVLSLCGKIQVKENPYSGIFYAVLDINAPFAFPRV